MTKLVLVVEDETPIQELLLEVFSDEGYKTLGAENGKEALHLLESVQADIILLDLIMPVLDGNGFLSELTKRDILIPVVLVSATSGKFKGHPLVKAVVPKPFDVDNLVKTVHKYLTGD